MLPCSIEIIPGEYITVLHSLSDGRRVTRDDTTGARFVEVAGPRDEADVQRRSANLAPWAYSLGGGFPGSTQVLTALADIFYGSAVYQPNFQPNHGVDGIITDIVVDVVIAGDWKLEDHGINNKIINALMTL